MYWKVGELAKLANISVRTLHHYEDIGLLIPIERTASGYRLYDENNVLKLMQILCLSRVGIPLQEVDIALKAYPEGILNILKQQLRVLSTEIYALQQLESQLASIVEKILSNQMPTWQDWKMNQELIAIYDEFFVKRVRNNEDSN
ncbi:MerR family DNA-binding transcriptional regulator [Ignatzschineria rhizosphaerae]|uniref:MerR family DNA-binding transcriptional regulator n=1 Tax=Ignatzschineria rhizosphaerae TaxID=2923279 RepID=A0ABY3X4X3_9GAMM|nr:MerR family DNA-binding transcriptional regulator [Ignatzschineria rhizosphaerae]UNM96769.1 MerR family DNA-binding transcriptional regulator [Ignatzschineria rhizosphaerae]